MRYLLYLTLSPMACYAASITINTVSVTAQSVAAFGTNFAELLGPFDLNPVLPPSATFHSATVCVAGTPGCPTTGSAIRAGRTRIRYTNVDVTCDFDEDCSPFGMGFTFSGIADGPHVFRFQLANVETDPDDAPIRGNLSLELKVGSSYTTRFLAFDTRYPSTWGPTAAIPLLGRPTPFTAYGMLIMYGLPANSRFRLLHSAEFDFENVPEPSALGLAGFGLAALVIFRRAAR